MRGCVSGRFIRRGSDEERDKDGVHKVSDVPIHGTTEKAGCT